MSILGNTPNLSTMRTLVEGLAYSNQIEIPVPGGFNSGMLDVVVGGADLGMADYDDTNGMSVKLKVPMSTGTQFKIVAWTPNQTVVNAGGQLAGWRNRIINGDCRVAQRGSIALSATSGGYGGPDRFSAGNGNTSGQFTQSQVIMAVNGVNKFAVQQTVNTAVASFTSTNYWAGISQTIEGISCHDLLGQPIVVSFWFLSNVSGNFSCAVRDGTATNYYASTFSAQANVPVKVIVPISNIPTGASLPNNSSAGLQVFIGAIGITGATTLNAWLSGSAFYANGMTNWASAINNYISVTELQIEPGSIATAFENRPYAAELSLCQRYYESGTNIWTFSNANYNTMTWKVTKRISPTFTVSGTPGTYTASGATVDGFYFVYTAGGSTNATVTYTGHADF